MTTRKTQIRALIDKYNITDNLDGNLRLQRKPTQDDIVKIKGLKEDILACFAADRKEQKEKEAATVKFYTPGWESHEVSIDTRHNIDKQLEEIAEYYKNDTTLELLKEAYAKAIKAAGEKEAKRAKSRAEKEAIYAKAKATSTKQILMKYMDECDGQAVDCSMDYVTIYAMPDGTTTEERIHAH